MSVGPLNPIAGFAGAPLAQTKGAEQDRARVDAARHEARVRDAAKAADAAGIAAADGEDKRAEDRDADGRRLWEFTERKPNDEAPESHDSPQSVDPTGERGGELDLSG
ncbi:MAG: hypothetical protein JNM18_07575 [Planctomycetaceae bacterium]|nr:hypothetical protein [Planctomycetaceae bacterium]